MYLVTGCYWKVAEVSIFDLEDEDLSLGSKLVAFGVFYGDSLEIACFDMTLLRCLRSDSLKLSDAGFLLEEVCWI